MAPWIPSRPVLDADVVDGIADSRTRCRDERIGARNAQAEHVDQRIAGVPVVECDLAADGRNADAVPVPCDAGYHAFDGSPGAGRFGAVHLTEAKRVHQRDRTRAHGEDVANDAADAGGRALVGLDERRVIVRLDFEHGGQSVADVHGSGVLPGPLQHARPLGRQLPEVDARALVAAVLGPHHRKDTELGD